MTKKPAKQPTKTQGSKPISGKRAALAIPPDVWIKVRAYWETTGASLRQTAEMFGVPKSSLHWHYRTEGWRRNPEGEVEIATVTKVAQQEAKRILGQGVQRKSVQEQGLVSNVTKIPETHAEVVETEAEIRANRIMRHRDQWQRFEDEVEAEAVRVFHDPPMRIRIVKGRDGEPMEVTTPDYSKVEVAKRIGEIIANRQKSERDAYNLAHNLNLSKKAEEAERDAMIKDTFSMLREAVREAKAREEAIDITPSGGRE